MLIPDALDKDNGRGEAGCINWPFTALISLFMLPWLVLGLITSGIFAVFAKADDIAEDKVGEGYRNFRSKLGRGFEFVLKALFVISIVIAVVQGCAHISNSDRDCDVGRGGMICR